MRMRPTRSDKLVSKGLTKRFVHEKQHATFHLHMSIFVHDESCMNALTLEIISVGLKFSG